MPQTLANTRPHGALARQNVATLEPRKWKRSNTATSEPGECWTRTLARGVRWRAKSRYFLGRQSRGTSWDFVAIHKRLLTGANSRDRMNWVVNLIRVRSDPGREDGSGVTAT